MISKYGLNLKLITVFFLALLLAPSLLSAAQLETVTNTNDAGAGSLRQAIADVDTGGEIVFDIPGAGPHTILIASSLEIDKALTITGPIADLLTITSGAGASSVIIAGDMLAVLLQVVISDLTVDGGTTASSGIYNMENLTLNNIVVTRCQIGIINSGQLSEFAQGPKVIVNNTTISGNTAGIFNSGGNAMGSTGGIVEVNNSSITENVAGSSTEGDGIVNQGGNVQGATGGTVVIRNSTISNNAGTAIIALGGLVAGSTGPITQISSSSISGNKFALIMFPVPEQLDASPVVEVKNSILANSTGLNCFLNGLMLTSLGVNIGTDDTCPGFIAVTPDELNLGALQNNGGPTQTQALIPLSAAMDIVDDCTFIDGEPVLTDQRGFLRPPTNCDAGAYEFGAVPPAGASKVPTLSEWGILLTVMLLGIAAVLYFNRNKKLT